jgi:hypothetical protein
VSCLRPLLGSIDIIGHLPSGEAQRVMLVKDNDAVPAVVLGYVGGSRRPLPPDPAKCIGRSALARLAEGPASTAADCLVQALGLRWRFQGTPSPQLIEKCPFERDEVGDLDDALFADGVHRAEMALDPGVHGLRRRRPAHRHADAVQTLEPGPVLCGKSGRLHIQGGDAPLGAWSSHDCTR